MYRPLYRSPTGKTITDQEVARAFTEGWGLMGSSGRHIGSTLLWGKRVWVSTVWLVIDHSWQDPPLLFETMIFGGQLDQDQWRYTTIEQAVEGHWKAVRRARWHWPWPARRLGP
jgi:hypothetical protein